MNMNIKIDNIDIFVGSETALRLPQRPGRGILNCNFPMTSRVRRSVVIMPNACSYQSTSWTSSPILVWKCNLPAFLGNHDRPTNQPTDKPTNRRTWGFVGKLHFQYKKVGPLSTLMHLLFVFMDHFIQCIYHPAPLMNHPIAILQFNKITSNEEFVLLFVAF